jgi:hypothetical protein
MNLKITIFQPIFPVELPWSDEPLLTIDTEHPSEQLTGCEVKVDPRAGLILLGRGNVVVAVPISLCVGIGTTSDILVQPTMTGKYAH